MSYVYIAPLRDRTAFKIGKSNVPSRRLSGLSKFYDFDASEIKIINCNTESEAFSLESVLHKSCSKERVAMPFDGGTEFFSCKVLASALGIANAVCEINDYKLTPFIPIEGVVISTEPELIINSFSNKIKTRRLHINITHKQLAARTGLSKRTIERIEAGEGVTFLNIVKVTTALGLSDLFSDFRVEDTVRKRASRSPCKTT
jgi:DNA-binding XRE family transcriptional regulator